MPPAISFRQASKEFRGDGKAVLRAVDSVDLDIEQGRIAGIIGYSGAGKSTLVRLVNGLETPTRGTVVVNGKNLAELTAKGMRELRGGVGMIFQQFNLFSSRTVAGNVAYPLKLAGWPRQRRAERVAELLDFVGIADKARQYPSQLSGGQKQRVGIARALATSPKVLLADEATSALDPETTRDVLQLLKKVNVELGVTTVVITHEMEVVRSIADRVVVMEDGRVVEDGTAFDVFARPRHPTTKRFVSTVVADVPTGATILFFAQSGDDASHLFPAMPLTLATATTSTAPISSRMICSPLVSNQSRSPPRQTSRHGCAVATVKRFLSVVIFPIAPPDSRFQEPIDVSVENGSRVAHLVIRTQVFDHLIRIQYVGSHLVTPGAAAVPLQCVKFSAFF